MIDIAVHELNKYYGSNHVLQGVSLEVYSGEKVGLLGRNGSGKTTLFKIIADDEPYDGGHVFKAAGKKVDILSQIPVFAEDVPAETLLRSSFKEITEIHDAMKKIEGDGNPAVLKRYGKLMEDYERLGGYDVEVKIEKICNGMNIGAEMRKSRFGMLSGGEKTRVNLARVLLRDCDILLLDEPTNHLDLASLEWLEKFLREFSGTVVIISHDRVFLDNVIGRVIEIQDGKLNFYQGNYSFYAAEKEQRFLTQAERHKQQQRKIHQLETAVKRQRVWAAVNPSNTGLSKRIVAFEKRIEQMDKVEKPVKSKRLTEDFNSGGYAAKQIVSFESVCKGYGANRLLDDINLTIGRNDRIALIGANGCGKTTLLKLIMGEEPCDSGVVKVSGNVRIAYMPQITTFEDENATVLETLRKANGLPEEKSRSILAGFHFKAPDVMKKAGDLSGGEKSRLKLCLLMQSRVNFLILDEPTNHLDIESREWIEDAVSDFDGTMLFISHDRYFLNKFGSRIWSMKNSEITDFHGGFNDYLKAIAPAESLSSPGHKKKRKPSNKAKAKPKTPISLDALIYETEAELENMTEPCPERQELQERLEVLYREWLEENENGGLQ